ncbi:hypothetical protein CsSME_00024211 [Camellia sinensis var. sinensis]
MAILGRLNTGDRLAMFGLTPNCVCPLCGANGKDHDHLFFQCPFSSKVWVTVLTKCKANWQSTNWLGLTEVVPGECKGKSLVTIIRRLGFCCTVYRMMKPIIESYEFAKSGLSDGSKKLSEHIYIEWMGNFKMENPLSLFSVL